MNRKNKRLKLLIYKKMIMFTFFTYLFSMIALNVSLPVLKFISSIATIGIFGYVFIYSRNPIMKQLSKGEKPINQLINVTLLMVLLVEVSNLVRFSIFYFSKSASMLQMISSIEIFLPYVILVRFILMAFVLYRCYKNQQIIANL